MNLERALNIKVTRHAPGSTRNGQHQEYPSSYQHETMFSSSFIRSLTSIGRKWKALNFPKQTFPRIAPWERIEEETLPDYVPSRYYPANIGEVLRDRYQIVSKLGFGASSTVWLARDLRYVELPTEREPCLQSSLTPLQRKTTCGSKALHHLVLPRRILKRRNQHLQTP